MVAVSDVEGVEPAPVEDGAGGPTIGTWLRAIGFPIVSIAVASMREAPAPLGVKVAFVGVAMLFGVVDLFAALPALRGRRPALFAALLVAVPAVCVLAVASESG